VLCTSVRNMKAVHGYLQGRVPGPLLIQGEAPKTLLLNRFMDNHQTVLVATTSFWQGVDIPGDALRLVIIDKLPFASPADPLVAARIAHIEEQGQNPFMRYQIPNAALVLKQGFGRLIRTRFDQGVVAVLDRRLHTMPYAKKFLDSLPPCPRLLKIEDVETWWRAERPVAVQSNPPRTA
jgi:ATP-dependent DNA helicase DinG